ncbi:imidazole glycerol phosphate synthase subunit HisH [Flagellimonas beolgyonensis]|uniref:imidazole glycerol phosphate synthase subunit HisH n=1 Tax=Flagellimonas beolgyonensis TaxID=864064 RepID=UPI0019D276C3|nr:imidazole glycerol phosphate synthase subunit HisH [Allomuricauda beolgyonensis]
MAIVDYGSSNLYSVINACKYFGFEVDITDNPQMIRNADAVILPGVGAFQQAMKNLERLDLIEPIKDFVESGNPFMGICLGLQLLFESSEEFGATKGLGLVNGTIRKFPNDLEKNFKVPQIGWNTIVDPKNGNWENSPLNSLKSEEFMYFVHSYYADIEDIGAISSLTTYNGTNYCSSLQKDNIFATQFHPEKSGEKGLEIYKNWFNSF